MSGARMLQLPLHTMNANIEISSKNTVDAPAQHTMHPPQNPHILLADGDSYTRALNTRVLTWSGYRVQTVANGAEAWNALELQNYDLLITENEMPALTGMQLLKHLRSRGVTMPVIIASGKVPTKELKLHPGIYPIDFAICSDDVVEHEK
jgi:CheY-like chemotaxis protein